MKIITKRCCTALSTVGFWAIERGFNICEWSRWFHRVFMPFGRRDMKQNGVLRRGAEGGYKNLGEKFRLQQDSFLLDKVSKWNV